MKILIAGDFVPRFRIQKMTESCDYSFFEEVKEYTAKSDYSIINLEAPIVKGVCDPIVKTGPNLKCSPYTMEAIKYAGFNCVTLANNHFYDYGNRGVVDTIDSCKSSEIDYVGGGVNLAAAEDILYRKVANKTLAVINFCENEWSIASETDGGSAPLNLIHNVRNIQKAKKTADYVLVIIHGGTEQYQLPSPRMKETYRFLVDQGADAVVNHHQHCYSGYEVYKEKPIFYGLGNFCFDKNDPNDNLWNEGYLVQIDFSEEKINFTVLPYIQCSKSANVSFLAEKSAFEESIDNLNKIIADEHKLQDYFAEMAISKSYLQILEPYNCNNKILRILKAKGILPSFLSREKKNLILNVFRCEAHKDVIFKLLQQ